MKLTRQDRQVINNFAKFNQNLEFKKDLKQQSSGRNLLAEYTLQSDEFKSFLIYDTKEFLKVIHCFNNPKVIINDDLITLQEFNNEFRYHTTEKSMIKWMILPEKTIDETISNQTPETQFELSFDDIKELQRVNDILKFPHLIIKPDEDNCHSLTYTDIHNKKSDEFSISTYQKTNRDYKVRVSGFNELPILISDYQVSIFEKSILLESKDIPLKYLIALEPKPTPDTKESEIKKNAKN